MSDNRSKLPSRIHAPRLAINYYCLPLLRGIVGGHNAKLEKLLYSHKNVADVMNASSVYRSNIT